MRSTAGMFGAGLASWAAFPVLCGTGSKRPASVPRQPNIVWIMLDDCRYDAWGCYGRSWAVTPAMDRMAREGVRFDAAIIQNTVCIPSRKSMKSGYYAYEIGPLEMGREPDIPEDFIDRERMKLLNASPNLLDSWTKRGMKPVNFGKIHAFPNSFDDRGDADVLFDVNGNPTPYFTRMFGKSSKILEEERLFTKVHHWQIGGKLTVKPEETETWRLCDMALQGLKELESTGKPFFMRVSFHAPHVACYVPEEYFIDPSRITLPVPQAEELLTKPLFERGPLHTYSGADLTPEQIGLCRGTYYGMVSLVDAQLGRIVNELERTGQLENTIIAITSDQGFQLGEHGLWKKRVFYEANVRVPLVIRYPRHLPRGITIMEPVELVDFLPTLLDLSGMDVPGNIRGASLLPLIRGEKEKWRKACFSEIDHSQSMYDELRQGTGRRIMVRTREWKLDYFMDNRVKDKDGALYNLEKDPDEKNNRYNDPGCRNIIIELEQLAREWAAGRNMLV